jgi:hypothetical protein
VVDEYALENQVNFHYKKTTTTTVEESMHDFAYES